MELVCPCRICLEPGASIPIFEPQTNSDPNVYSKLCECIGEKIEDLDGHPRHICTLCHITLNTALKFIKQYRESTEILKQCRLNVKEEPVEFNELDDTGYEGDDMFLIHFADGAKKEPKLEPDFEIDTKKSNKKQLCARTRSKKAIRKSKAIKKVKQKPKEQKSELKDISIKKEKKEITKERLCHLCGILFPNSDRLYHHRSTVHREREVNEKPGETSKCPQCQREFSCQKKMEAHVKRIHSPDAEKKHVCSVCGRRFMFPGELRNHNRTHREDKRRAACTLCDKSFVSKKSLQVHMRSCHTGERPEVCIVCNKSFFDPDYLKEHMRLHTGERPFKCPVCGKGFAQRGNMKSHIRHNHRRSQLDAATLEALSKCKTDYIRLMNP